MASVCENKKRISGMLMRMSFLCSLFRFMRVQRACCFYRGAPEEVAVYVDGKYMVELKSLDGVGGRYSWFMSERGVDQGTEGRHKSSLVQSNQESRRKYWATYSTVCLFTRTALSRALHCLLHLLARSLTPVLVGK